MTSSEISNIRLINQKITETGFETAKEIVGWMGAMQAQDYAMAKWAIGHRINNATDKKIETAYNNGEIIRTHLMRPTWHFVTPEDIYWMLELTAPKLKSMLKPRNKELELTEAVFVKAFAIIEKEILKNNNLTRDELTILFNQAGIKTDNNRLSHIMMQAELEGLVCSGPVKNKKLTFALLRERVPNKKLLSRDESLAELANRYFTSHCPATLRDFIWWSGLSVVEAKKAVELIKPNFISETIGQETYFYNNSSINVKHMDIKIHLLPAYDEFLISYKDRNASISLVANKKTISENGVFRPIIVMDGQVVGIWKRTTKKDKVIIEPQLFQPWNHHTKETLKNTAKNFENFINKKVEMIFE